MIIIVIKKMRKLIINFFLKDRKFPSVFVVLQISTLTLGKIKIEKQVWLKSEKDFHKKIETKKLSLEFRNFIKNP
jgi:hypothetical protein